MFILRHHVNCRDYVASNDESKWSMIGERLFCAVLYYGIRMKGLGKTTEISVVTRVPDCDSGRIRPE
jgi:hypothetical protein